jgi:3-oxoacyl-[acyl-carrier protein] reductase
MTAERDLAGKVALVIGGSRNQGAAIAENLAGRGATTVIGCSSGEDCAGQALVALQEHGVAAEALRADATPPADAADAIFAGAVAHYGRVDIVVHVPGNTRNAFDTLRAASRHIADNGRCVVVSTTLNSIMTGTHGLDSKAAVERLVLAAAKELGPRCVTVNAVAPGPVETSFHRAAATKTSIAAATRHSPRNRLGTPSTIASVVGWLVSDSAGWVSGQTIGAMF